MESPVRQEISNDISCLESNAQHKVIFLFRTPPSLERESQKSPKPCLVPTYTSQRPSRPQQNLFAYSEHLSKLRPFFHNQIQLKGVKLLFTVER